MIGGLSLKSLQLGNNKSNPLGSKQFPDRIWLPISEPFSTTQTDIFLLSYLILIAVLSPDGPPPTIQTS